jgi:hypothetical protein
LPPAGRTLKDKALCGSALEHALFAESSLSLRPGVEFWHELGNKSNSDVSTGGD